MMNHSIDNIHSHYFLYSKSEILVNVYTIMILIHHYDNFIFYIAIFLIIIGILALLLTFLYSPYHYHNIKNIINLPMIENFNLL
jgi:peptidoglycan biosynthesis protein MviN/MurJ (putative lipid II flippase)